jgi:hypothetical protein
MNTIIITQASVKSNGDTNTIVNELNKQNTFYIIDLKTKNVGHFEYDFANADGRIDTFRKFI